MFFVSATLCSLLFGLLLIMIGLSLNFAAYFRRHQNLERGDYAPKVGILLPLRGSDPYLKRCLLALTKQKYPDYAVHVVVDSEDDPARFVVEEVIAETNSKLIQLDFLRHKPDTCNLKSAALLQAYDALPEDCEVVAQLDADSYPYPNWLSDLVAGLQEPGVGMTTGFRWYSPSNPTLASLVRHVWNSGAIVQMLPMQIGWGGSLAFTREVFEKADLRRLLETSLCDDTVITSAILDSGYQLRMMPRVAMINEEDTSFRGCLNFIRRQILFVRLYHRSFPLACFYALVSALIHAVSAVMLVVMFTTGHYREGLCLLAGVAVYIISQANSVWIGEFIFGKAQAAADRPPIRMSPLTLPLAVLLTFIVYPICMMRAIRTKQISWRGIRYTIERPFSIRRENYEPYRAELASGARSL